MKLKTFKQLVNTAKLIWEDEITSNKRLETALNKDFGDEVIITTNSSTKHIENIIKVIKTEFNIEDDSDKNELINILIWDVNINKEDYLKFSFNNKKIKINIKNVYNTLKDKNEICLQMC